MVYKHEIKKLSRPGSSLDFPEQPSCRHSTIPFGVRAAQKMQQKQHIRISVRQLCKILPHNRLMNKLEGVRRSAHRLV